MNQRIRQLADQTRQAIPRHTLDVQAWLTAYHDKFGELVTKDCIQTLINNGYDDAAQCLQDVHFGMDDPV